MVKFNLQFKIPLSECPGVEDICKTTVTRQVFFEQDHNGAMTNTTVGNY